MQNLIHALYTHIYTPQLRQVSITLLQKQGERSSERDMVEKGRWIEVLKKMMHHHTFTLFPRLLRVWGREFVCVCVCACHHNFLHAFKCACRCVEVRDVGYVTVDLRVCVCKNADTMFKQWVGWGVGRRGGSSLLVPAISERANFHLKEHSAPLFLSFCSLSASSPPLSSSISMYFRECHLSDFSFGHASVSLFSQ